MFEAGSITKGLTGLLLAQMVSSGELELDQPIGSLLPAGLELAPELAAITLEELATHRSGLPRLASGPEMQARMTSDNPYAGSTPEEIFADLARVQPNAMQAGRGRFAYSNLGVALLGQLLARSAGESYEALLAERVFEPLDLRAPVLGPDAVTERRAVMRRDLAGHPGTGMGLGWHHAKVGDREIVWHNGGTAGSSSFLAVVPVERLVVAVLANGGGGIVDGLARGLLASGR